MPEKKPGYVFISYSRRDDAVMRRIVKHLREQGIKAWVDNEKLIPGTPVWENEIEKAIKGAFAIVVVLSPDAKKSEWVLREITLADQYQKRAFPVLVAGKNEDSIPFRLITRQFVDIRKDESTGLKSLGTAISFYSEEFTRLEDERKAAEVEAARHKYEREVAEQVASDAKKKAESEKKSREEAERLANQKSEEERLEKESIKRKAARKATWEKINENIASFKSGIETRGKSIIHAFVKTIRKVIESYRKIPSQTYMGLFIFAIIIGTVFWGNRWYISDQSIKATSTAIANVASTEMANVTSTEAAKSTSTAIARDTSTAISKATSTAIANATSTAVAQTTFTAIAEATTTAVARTTFTAVAIANAQATQDAKVFFDNFDNNSNNWDVGSQNGFNGDEKVYSSFISITDGVYIWDITEVNSSYVIASQSPPDEKSVEDFLLSVDALNHSKNPDLCYGLAFRMNLFYLYRFTICDDQRYRVIVIDSNGTTDITGWNDSLVIKPYDWNQIKVITNGSQFDFYINNVQVDQVNNTSLTSGTLGVFFEAKRGQSGQIWFDNFRYEIR